MSKKAKLYVAKVPVIGYILRWVSGFLLLPRHLSYTRNALNKDRDSIEALEATTIRANKQVIELTDRVDKLSEELKKNAK